MKLRPSDKRRIREFGKTACKTAGCFLLPELTIEVIKIPANAGTNI